MTDPFFHTKPEYWITAREGVTARHEGKSVDDNPYNKDNEKYKFFAWRNGFTIWGEHQSSPSPAKSDSTDF